MSWIKQDKPQIQQHFPQITYLEAAIKMAWAQESEEKKMLEHHQCPSGDLAQDYWVTFCRRKRKTHLVACKVGKEEKEAMHPHHTCPDQQQSDI